jgi:hypothetical protein
MEVPYPPPAARVEIIPRKPRDGAVWLDGEWQWEGKVWAWEPGGWVLPPTGAYLAPWVTYRQENGKLLFAPGSWHAEDGSPLPKPIVLAPAQSSLEPLPPEVPEDAAARDLPEAAVLPAATVLPEASAVSPPEARD